MSDLPDKPRAVAALRAVIAAELAALERIASDTRDEVGGEESRAEGKYDTRSTEASYLARGQAWRIVELRQQIAWFGMFDPTRAMDRAAVGALVLLDGPRRERIFLAPMGGASAEVDGARIRAISPSSPLGRAMSGLEAGDGFEVETPRGLVEYEILEIDGAG